MSWRVRIKRALMTPRCWRLLHAVRPAGVVVLTYHRVEAPGAPFPGLPVEQFRAQMHWLRRHCRLIAADDFPAVLAHPPRGRANVLVTFDDGYRSFHDVAFPVLRELDIPALVFLPTELIGSRDLIWTDAVYCAVVASTRNELQVPWSAASLPLPLDPEQREAVADQLKGALKRMPEPDRARHLPALYAALGVPDPAALHGRQLMNWQEIRATQPLIRYGGHSHRHAILSSLEGAALLEDLQLCRATLDRELGAGVRLFAYPNGERSDFDGRTIRILGELGFDHLFTTLPGRLDARSDRSALARQPTGARDLVDFAWLAAGIGAGA